jgi:hypothetical protein
MSSSEFEGTTEHGRGQPARCAPPALIFHSAGWRLFAHVVCFEFLIRSEATLPAEQISNSRDEHAFRRAAARGDVNIVIPGDLFKPSKA